MSESIRESIELLQSVVSVAGDYLAPHVRDEADQTLQRVSQRQMFAEQTTVVAIAGPTGAGKSSLINALIGEDLVKVAATRPTTSAPTAISSQTIDSDSLITQWLDIAQRYERTGLEHVFHTAAPFVLVDLPDIDSTSASNREQAAEIIGKADVVVWIVDPQKYADSSVHDEYLINLSEHSDVMLTVLNQSDRLAPADRTHVIESLTQILHSNSIDSPIVLTSATTGEGIDELRSRISAFAQAKKAATDKLAADIRTLAYRISEDFRSHVSQEPVNDTGSEQKIIASALRAGGALVLSRLAGESYTHRAKKATRWPLTRWVGRLKVDPLERFRLGAGQVSEDVVPVTGIARSEVALQEAANGYQRYVERRTAGMPTRWAQKIVKDTDNTVANLVRRADYIGTHTDIEANRHPIWWRVVNLIHWLLLGTVIVGLGWIALRAFAINLGIWVTQPPMVGIFPLPLVIAVCGIALGWMLSGISAVIVRRGAARTEKRIQRRLVNKFQEEMHDELIVPLDEAIAQYQQVKEHLDKLQRTQS
ncbi:50S ribosome-binding GTPase [Arcanobacterium phocisimile]|uniref:50S ribosome-binding GTPase n=1 Tax=Arcanobacterium phocisimile TaxID=1302235 RepID=A0ABX7IJL3_9ACTO|nr:GTPase [Arcanobacterium phocisimile]QRV02925.1 50S ribosome-binding GTPase [Arcanobacterium phocisimile]